MMNTDVGDYLKKHKGKWFNAKELTKALKHSHSVIARALVHLRYWGCIKQETHRPYGTRYYTYKG